MTSQENLLCQYSKELGDSVDIDDLVVKNVDHTTVEKSVDDLNDDDVDDAEVDDDDDLDDEDDNKAGNDGAETDQEVTRYSFSFNKDRIF